MPSVKFRNGTLAFRCYIALCSHCEADIKVHHKLKYGSAVRCDACMKESIVDEIDLEDERDLSDKPVSSAALRQRRFRERKRAAAAR